MPQDTILGNAIAFLDKVGIYDVVLPFILVFTIVFAILDKSRIFGVEVGKSGTKYPKKNVNSLVAFVIAFFVIASSQLVEIITQVSAQMVILLLSSVFFLLLIGIFHKDEELIFAEKYTPMTKVFIGIMFVGLVFIFLNAIKTPSGESWLIFGLYWLQQNISSGLVSTVIVLVGVGVFMYWLSGGESEPKEKKEKAGE